MFFSVSLALLPNGMKSAEVAASPSRSSAPLRRSTAWRPGSTAAETSARQCPALHLVSWLERFRSRNQLKT